MTLPLSDMTTFIYSFYGLVAVTLFVVKSVNVAVDTFKRGVDYAS
jgi:hypothetical protein